MGGVARICLRHDAPLAPRLGSPWAALGVTGPDCKGLGLCGIDTNGHTGRVEETMRQMQEHRGVLAARGLADGSGPQQRAQLILHLKYEAQRVDRLAAAT